MTQITYLTVVPFFLTIILLLCYSPRQVYLYYFIPLWLLIPPYYYLNILLLPDLNFTHFASLPLFGWWVCRGLPHHRVSFLDLIVAVYLGWSVYAEWEVGGERDGINLLIDRFVSVVIPYCLAKYFLRFPNIRVQMLKVMVVIGAALTIPSLVEFRLGFAPIDPLHYIWPYKSRWSGISRLGVMRVAATFLHPIISALMWALFSLFNLWLIKVQAFKKWINGYIALILNIGGLFMGISRGPVVGWMCGLIFLGVGWSKYRFRWALFVSFVFAVSIFPLSVAIYDYIAVGRWQAKTPFQETAAYRYELWENYAEVIADKLVTGYGRIDFPIHGGQASIDSQYLYIALLHGLPAVAVFVFMTVYQGIRTFVISWLWPTNHPNNQLAWMLNACLVVWAFTLITVWMGGQSEQMVFLLLAFADVLGHELTEPAPIELPYYTFQRIA